MPLFQNNPFPEVTDFGGYQNWNKVVLPDGRVLYEVPGNPGYVYDPVRSRATGRQSFTINPKMQLAEMERQRQQQDAQLKQQEYMNSPMGQAVPIVGSLGGMYLASKLAQGGSLFGGGGSGLGSSLGSSSGSGLNSGSITLPSRSVPGVGDGLGSGMETLGNAASVAAMLYGGYNAAKGWGQGGEGVRSGLTTAGAGLGNLIGGPIGGAIGAAGGNAIGYGFQGDGWKNDVVLGAISPTLLIGKKLGLKPHVSTRQQTASNTQKLFDVGKDDPTYQAYVEGMRRQYQEDPTDPEAPFAGKYKSWDEYEQAGLDASDLTGVYGNIKQYGPEWAKLTQEQRKAITQENINRGNYYSKKGDVFIKDKQKAQEAYDAVMAPLDTFAAAAAGAAPRLTPGAQAPAMAPGGPATITEDEKKAIKRFMRR